MVDDFEGSGNIILHPGDTKKLYGFVFMANSDESANDGFLPFNTTIDSATIIGYNQKNVANNTLVDNFLISGNGNVIMVWLNYPGVAGYYKIVFSLTLNNLSKTVMTALFTRIKAEII